MYNSDTPLRAELPSSKQLVRSTVLAALAALVLLLAVVLPAEYGIDPTGVGRVLRMTEMGDIKQQLAAEAATNAAATAATSSSAATATAAATTVATAVPAPTQATAPKIEWRDEIPFTLTPGEGTEIKLTMAQGAKAQYA
jgi:hypothetical protein